MFQKDQKRKVKPCESGHSDNRHIERTRRKCFRCGSKYHLIAIFPKPPKDNQKQLKKVCFNEKGNCACNNGKDNSDQNIYAYIARMSVNDECPNGDFGDSL